MTKAIRAALGAALTITLVAAASCSSLGVAAPVARRLPEGFFEPVRLALEEDGEAEFIVLFFDDRDAAKSTKASGEQLILRDLADSPRLDVRSGFRIANLAREHGFQAGQLRDSKARAALARAAGARFYLTQDDSRLALYEAGRPSPLAVAGARALPTLGSRGLNLALGMTVVASSVHGADNRAELMADGDVTTRWESRWTDPQWFVIDFGRTVSLERIVIKWEFARAKEYIISVSDDGEVWKPIQRVRYGDAYTFYPQPGKAGTARDETLFVRGSGRYLRYDGMTRTTGWGHSIWEFEAYGVSLGPTIVSPGREERAVAGVTARLAIEAEPAGADPVLRSWLVFDDGEWAEGPVVERRFSEAGIYGFTAYALSRSGYLSERRGEALVGAADGDGVDPQSLRARDDLKRFYDSLRIAEGAYWESSDPNAVASYGAFLFNNAGWNSMDGGYGTQTLWVDTAPPLRWGVKDIDHSRQGMVKSFPNAQIGWHYGLWSESSPLPIAVGSIRALDLDWDFETMANGSYNGIVQLYVSSKRSGGIERDILIGLDRFDWPLDTNSSDFVGWFEIGGRRWYHAYNPRHKGGEHIVFYLETPTRSVRGLDVKAILDFCLARSYFSPEEYLVTMEHGWEIIRGRGAFSTTAFDYRLIAAD